MIWNPKRGLQGLNESIGHGAFWFIDMFSTNATWFEVYVLVRHLLNTVRLFTTSIFKQQCCRPYTAQSCTDFTLNHRVVSSIPKQSCTVTPDRTIAWSYDQLLFGERATDRQCLLRSPSVFLPGGRSSYDWSYAWSRDQQRLEKIVRLVVAINDRSYDRSWPPTIDRMINSVGRRMGSDLNPRNISTFYSVSEQPIGGTTGRKVARAVARLIVRRLRFGIAGFKIWTWPSTLLRLMCPLRSHTTSATSRTTYATSRTFVLRLAHHSNFFRSQVGRNLVVSQVWPGFEHDYDLVATDLPLAITHDLCHQSYVLSTIGSFFGRR